MSSGLDFAEEYAPGTDATKMLFSEYSAGNYAVKAGLAYPPGTHWSYSSGTSNILAVAIWADNHSTVHVSPELNKACKSPSPLVSRAASA